MPPCQGAANMRAPHLPTPALGTLPAARAGPRLSLGLPPTGHMPSPLSGSVCRGGSWDGDPGSVRGTPCRMCARTASSPAQRTSCKGTKVNGRRAQHGGRSAGKPSRERLHRASVHRAGCPQSCHSPGLAQHPALEIPAGLSPMVKGTHKALRDLQRSRLVLQGLSRSGWAKPWVQLLAIPRLVPACSLNHLAESNRFCFQQEQDISHVLYHFKGNLLPSPAFCTKDSDAAGMQHHGKLTHTVSSKPWQPMAMQLAFTKAALAKLCS